MLNKTNYQNHQALKENYQALLAAPEHSTAEAEAQEKILEATDILEIQKIALETYQTICGTMGLDKFKNKIIPLILEMYKQNPKTAGLLLLKLTEQIGYLKPAGDNPQAREINFAAKFDNLVVKILNPEVAAQRTKMERELNALSPIDGRYANATEELRNYFSEKALIRYRTLMEIEYFIALMKQLADSNDSIAQKSKARKLTTCEKQFMRNLPDKIDPIIIKLIEKQGWDGINRTNHDVKAVEEAIKKEMGHHKTLHDLAHFIHLGITSEDTTNIAYALMIKDGLEKTIVPHINQVIEKLENKALDYQTDSTLGLTHGQAATPKTFGHIFRVMCERLKEQRQNLQGLKIKAKLTGAVGNLAALKHVFPSIDWLDFSQNFIRSLNNIETTKNIKTEAKFTIEPNIYTKQIEPHDNLIRFCQNLQLFANILEGECLDIWLYISREALAQKIITQSYAKETGSSTMPHKINPIDFENAEGNFIMAKGILNIFVDRLPISRMDRDLSDSTIIRNIGTAFGHLLIGLKSFSRGLDKIEPNIEVSRNDLDTKPEVLSEYLQVLLRAVGITDAYQRLKDKTRGKKVTYELLKEFIGDLNLQPCLIKRALELKPSEYIGESKRIAKGNI